MSIARSLRSLVSLLHSLIILALSNNSSFFHQSLAFEKCHVVEETVAMDLVDSAVTAMEGNLPKPLKLLGNFHYVYPLLAVVETNVVFFFPCF